MKAICFGHRGGPEALEIQELPVPRPGSGEVLVRVHAAAVTPTELDWSPTWTLASGAPRAFPIIPGHEFSGVVESLGPDAADVAAGDAVFGMNDWYRNGAQAERCLARVIDLAAKPVSIPHVLAAATPISALTAWQGLIERAKLASGERALIHGGAGGVGLFAVQFAKRQGAQVVATASAHNLDFVRSLGADQVIDRRAQRFEDAGAFDVIFDTVGGETLDRSWPLLRPGGRLATIAADGERTGDPRVRAAFFIVEPSRPQLERIAAMLDAGELRVLAGAEFPLAEARRAYEHKPLRGKVVLRTA